MIEDAVLALGAGGAASTFEETGALVRCPNHPEIWISVGDQANENAAFELADVRDPAHPELFARRLDSDLHGQAAKLKRLRSGASQIKAMAGGGVSSYYDPLDVTRGMRASARNGRTDARCYPVL